MIGAARICIDFSVDLMSRAEQVGTAIRATLMVVLFAVSIPAGQGELTTEQVLAAYARGDAGPVESLDPLTLRFDDFERDATRWINASDIDRPRRLLAAASVAVEIASGLRGEPPEYGAAYLVWASEEVRRLAAGPPSALERRWHLAAVATMQSLDLPWVLAAGMPTGNSRLARHREAIGAGGQIARALRRWPEEPRFLLGRLLAVGAEAALTDAPPAFMTFVRGRASAEAPATRVSRQSQAAVERQQGVDLLRRRAMLPALIADLTALSAVDSIRAEAILHIGYLEGVRENWPVALGHLGNVSALTSDPYLIYVGVLATARVFLNAGDSAGAMVFLEQSLRLQPRARTATTLLAAELMASGSSLDWDRARRLLEEAHAPDASEDPWDLFRRGDARYRTTYLAALREGFK